MDGQMYEAGFLGSSHCKYNPFKSLLPLRIKICEVLPPTHTLIFERYMYIYLYFPLLLKAMRIMILNNKETYKKMMIIIILLAVKVRECGNQQHFKILASIQLLANFKPLLIGVQSRISLVSR